MKYLYIIGTIVFTVYGQLILKWRLNGKGQLPTDLLGKITFIFQTYLDIWIISGFVSALLASTFWILAMTKFELSYAYPFMSASFVLVFICSIMLFNEQFTLYKLLGLLFIIMGIIISSRP